MKHPPLTVRALRTRAVNAPMARPLGTSVARMEVAPFILVDLETEEGVTGRAHAFCYMDFTAPAMHRVLDIAGPLIAGTTVDPDAVGRACRNHFTLLGTQGVVGMALSALDVACWDALAQAAGLPLARYLGGEATSVPAYNSNGLSLAEPDGLADEAIELLEQGFDAVKIRLGRDDADQDLHAVRAVRSAIPTGAPLMADYNQALSVREALQRGASLEDESLYWIEEAVAHDDLLGSAEVARGLKTPIQSGENFCGPDVMAAAIRLRATDYVMPDLMRIGGVTGWLRAAALAKEAGMPMSSHLYPEVGVHLLAATPTAHWLEYVDWAEPFLTAGVSISDGRVLVPDTPGTSVTWDEEAVGRYAVD